MQSAQKVAEVRGRRMKKSLQIKLDRMTEIEDDLFYAEKLIARGEATRAELQSQLNKLNAEYRRLEKELKKAGLI
jgi:archaellum component FlaC